MEKIIFSHSDEQKQQHEALREKLKRDTESFLKAGGKIDVRKPGESVETQSTDGMAGFTEIARQRAAAVNKKHGGRLTEKQREVMQAIRELSQVPGIRVTRQGVKNKMHLQFNVLNDRLKLLANKGMIRVVGDEIIVNNCVGGASWSINP